MEKRNVLVIAYYFPPMGLSGVQRTVKFVKYLPEHDWNPIVLTTNPASYYAFDETFFDELGNDIKIYRTEKDVFGSSSKSKKPLAYPSQFKQKLQHILLQSIFQPDSRRLWKKPALRLAEKIIEENEISVIYATAPPFTDFLIAREISEKYNIPFVVDYRDLWVDNAFYFYVTPFHKLYSIRLETDVLKGSSKAIVTARYLKELILRRYKFLSHDDITIIPHGYDSGDFKGKDNIQPNPDKFTITHSGLFPNDLTPKYFLRALANFLSNNPGAKSKISAKFVGLLRKSHTKLINKLGLDDVVEKVGYVSHDEAVSHLLQSDALWMMITNNIATPSRLYEYLGAQKPILISAPEGNIRQIAMDSSAAFATQPKDIKSIENAIKQMFELWEKGKLPKPNREYIEKFDRKYLTSELARELSLAADIEI